MRTFLILLASALVVGCPDPAPDCPAECESVYDGEELLHCNCSPDYLADLIKPRDCPPPPPSGYELERICDNL